MSAVTSETTRDEQANTPQDECSESSTRKGSKLVAATDATTEDSAPVIVLSDSSSSEGETDDSDCEESSSDATVTVSSSDDEVNECSKTASVHCILNKNSPKNSTQKSKNPDSVTESNFDSKLRGLVSSQTKNPLPKHNAGNGEGAPASRSSSRISKEGEKDTDITLINVKTSKNYSRYSRLAAIAAAETPDKKQAEDFIPFISDNMSQAQRKEKIDELEPVGEDFDENNPDLFKSARGNSGTDVRDSLNHSVELIKHECDVGKRNMYSKFFQAGDVDERKMRSGGVSQAVNRIPCDVDERRLMGMKNEGVVRFFNSTDTDERSSSTSFCDIDERGLTKFYDVDDRPSSSKCTSSVSLNRPLPPAQIPPLLQNPGNVYLQTFDSGKSPQSLLSLDILSASLSADKLDNRNLITPPLVNPEMGTISFQSENPSSNYSCYTHNSTSQLQHPEGKDSLCSPTRILATDVHKSFKVVNPPVLQEFSLLSTDEKQVPLLPNSNWNERTFEKVHNMGSCENTKNRLTNEPHSFDSQFYCSSSSKITAKEEIKYENSLRQSVANGMSKLSAGMQKCPPPNVGASKPSTSVQGSTQNENFLKPFDEGNKFISSSFNQSHLSSKSSSDTLASVKSSSPQINIGAPCEREVTDESNCAPTKAAKTRFTYSHKLDFLCDSKYKTDVSNCGVSSKHFPSSKPSRTYSRVNSRTMSEVGCDDASGSFSVAHAANRNSVHTSCQRNKNNVLAIDDNLIHCKKPQNEHFSILDSDTKHDVDISSFNSQSQALLRSGVHTYSRSRFSMSNLRSIKKDKYVEENVRRPSSCFELQKLGNETSLLIQDSDQALSHKSLPTKDISKSTNTATQKKSLSSVSTRNVSDAPGRLVPSVQLTKKEIANKRQEKANPVQCFTVGSLERKTSLIDVQPAFEFTSKTGAYVQNSNSSETNKSSDSTKPTATHSFDTSCMTLSSGDLCSGIPTQAHCRKELTLCTPLSTLKEEPTIDKQPIQISSAEFRTGVGDLTVEKGRKRPSLDGSSANNTTLLIEESEVAEKDILRPKKSTGQLSSQFQNVNTSGSTTAHNPPLLDKLKTTSSDAVSHPKSVKIKVDKHPTKLDLTNSSNKHNSSCSPLHSESPCSPTRQSKEKIFESPSRASKTEPTSKSELTPCGRDMASPKQLCDVYEFRHSPSRDLEQFSSLASFRRSKMSSAQDHKKSLQNKVPLHKKHIISSDQSFRKLSSQPSVDDCSKMNDKKKSHPNSRDIKHMEASTGNNYSPAKDEHFSDALNTTKIIQLCSNSNALADSNSSKSPVLSVSLHSDVLSSDEKYFDVRSSDGVKAISKPIEVLNVGQSHVQNNRQDFIRTNTASKFPTTCTSLDNNFCSGKQFGVSINVLNNHNIPSETNKEVSYPGSQPTLSDTSGSARLYASEPLPVLTNLRSSRNSSDDSWAPSTSSMSSQSYNPNDSEYKISVADSLVTLSANESIVVDGNTISIDDVVRFCDGELGGFDSASNETISSDFILSSVRRENQIKESKRKQFHHDSESSNDAVHQNYKEADLSTASREKIMNENLPASSKATTLSDSTEESNSTPFVEHSFPPGNDDRGSSPQQDLENAQDKENFDPSLQEFREIQGGHSLLDLPEDQFARSGPCRLHPFREEVVEDTPSSLVGEEEPASVLSTTSTLRPINAPILHSCPLFASVTPQRGDAVLEPLPHYDGAIMYCHNAVATLPARTRPDGYTVYHVFERDADDGCSGPTCPAVQQVVDSARPLETLFDAVLKDLPCERPCKVSATCSSNGQKEAWCCMGNSPAGVKAGGDGDGPSACSSCVAPVGAVARDVSTICDDEHDGDLTRNVDVATSSSKKEDSSSESRCFDSSSDSDLSDAESIFDWSCDEFGPTLLEGETENCALMSTSGGEAASDSELGNKKLSTCSERTPQAPSEPTCVLEEDKVTHENLDSELSVGENLASAFLKEKVTQNGCNLPIIENSTLERDLPIVTQPFELDAVTRGVRAHAETDRPGGQFHLDTTLKTRPSPNDTPKGQTNSSGEAQDKSSTETRRRSLRPRKRRDASVEHEEAFTADSPSLPCLNALLEVPGEDGREDSDDYLPSISAPEVLHEHDPMSGVDGSVRKQLSPTSFGDSFNTGDMRLDHRPAFFRLPTLAAAADPSMHHLYRVYELELLFPRGGCTSLQWRRALRRLRRIPSLVSVTPDEENKKLMVALHVRSTAPADEELGSGSHVLKDLSHKQPLVAPAVDSRTPNSTREAGTDASLQVVENSEMHRPPGFDGGLACTRDVVSSGLAPEELVGEKNGGCGARANCVDEDVLAGSKGNSGLSKRELTSENRTKLSRRALVDRVENSVFNISEEPREPCSISKFSAARIRWQELPPVSRILRILRRLDTCVRVTDAESMEVDGLGDLISPQAQLCCPDYRAEAWSGVSEVHETNEKLGPLKASTSDDLDSGSQVLGPGGAVAAVDCQHSDGIYCLCDCADCREDEFKNETSDSSLCFCSVSLAWLFENRPAGVGFFDSAVRGLWSDESRCRQKGLSSATLADVKMTAESPNVSQNTKCGEQNAKISKSEVTQSKTSDFRILNDKYSESKNLSENNSQRKHSNSILSKPTNKNSRSKKLRRDYGNEKNLTSEKLKVDSTRKEQSQNLSDTLSKQNARKKKCPSHVTNEKIPNISTKPEVRKSKKLDEGKPLEVQVSRKGRGKQTPAGADAPPGAVRTKTKGRPKKCGSLCQPELSSSVSAPSSNIVEWANFRDLKLSKACQSSRCIYKKRGVLENFQVGDSLPLLWCSDNHRIVAKGTEASAFVEKLVAGNQPSLEEFYDLSNIIEAPEHLEWSETPKCNLKSNRSRGSRGPNSLHHRISGNESGVRRRQSKKESAPEPKKSKIKTKQNEVKAPAKRKDSNKASNSNRKPKEENNVSCISSANAGSKYVKKGEKEACGKTLERRLSQDSSLGAKGRPGKKILCTNMNSRDKSPTRLYSFKDLFPKSQEILSGCPVFSPSLDPSPDPSPVSRIWLDPAFYDSPLSVPLLRRRSHSPIDGFENCSDLELTGDSDSVPLTAADASCSVEPALETTDGESASISEVGLSASKPIIRDRNKHVLKVELKNCMCSSSSSNMQKLEDFPATVRRQASSSRAVMKHLDDPRRRLKYHLPSKLSGFSRIVNRNKMLKKSSLRKRLISNPGFVVRAGVSALRQMPLSCDRVRHSANTSDTSADDSTGPRQSFTETLQQKLADAPPSVCGVVDELVPREASGTTSSASSSSLTILASAQNGTDVSEDSSELPDITVNSSSESIAGDLASPEANKTHSDSFLTCAVNPAPEIDSDEKNSKKKERDSIRTSSCSKQAVRTRNVRKVIQIREASEQSNAVSTKKKRMTHRAAETAQDFQSREKIETQRYRKKRKTAKKFVPKINSEANNKEDPKKTRQKSNEAEKLRIEKFSESSSERSGMLSNDPAEDDSSDDVLSDPSWVPEDNESETEYLEETDLNDERTRGNFKPFWKWCPANKKRLNSLSSGLDGGAARSSGEHVSDECSEVTQLMEESTRLTSSFSYDGDKSKVKFDGLLPSKNKRVRRCGPASSKLRGAAATIDFNTKIHNAVEEGNDSRSDGFTSPNTNDEIEQQINKRCPILTCDNSGSPSDHPSPATARDVEESNELVEGSSNACVGNSTPAEVSDAQSFVPSPPKSAMSDPVAPGNSCELFKEVSNIELSDDSFYEANDASSSKRTVNCERRTESNGEKKRPDAAGTPAPSVRSVRVDVDDATHDVVLDDVCDIKHRPIGENLKVEEDSSPNTISVGKLDLETNRRGVKNHHSIQREGDSEAHATNSVISDSEGKSLHENIMGTNSGLSLEKLDCVKEQHVISKVSEQKPKENNFSDSNREKCKPKSFVDSFFQFIFQSRSSEEAPPRKEPPVEEGLSQCQNTMTEPATAAKELKSQVAGFSIDNNSPSEQNHTSCKSPQQPLQDDDDDDDVAVLFDDNAVDPLFVGETDILAHAANNEATLKIPSPCACIPVDEEASSTDRGAMELTAASSTGDDDQICENSTQGEEVQSTTKSSVALVPKLFRHILLPRSRTVSDSSEGKPLVDPMHKVLVESNQVESLRKRGCRLLLPRNRTTGKEISENNREFPLSGASSSSGSNRAVRGRPSHPYRSSSRRGRAENSLSGSLCRGRVRLNISKVKHKSLDESSLSRVSSDAYTSSDNSRDGSSATGDEALHNLTILDLKLRLKPTVRLKRIDDVVGPIKRKLNPSDERDDIHEEDNDETILPKRKKFDSRGRRSRGHFRFKERTADHIAVST